MLNGFLTKPGNKKNRKSDYLFTRGTCPSPGNFNSFVNKFGIYWRFSKLEPKRRCRCITTKYRHRNIRRRMPRKSRHRNYLGHTVGRPMNKVHVDNPGSRLIPKAVRRRKQVT